MRVSTGLIVSVVAGLSAAARATDFNVSVVSATGASSVTAPPSCKVRFLVTASLSDTLNDGLGAFSLDLRLTAQGSLTPIANTLEPANHIFGGTLGHFTRPLGLTNPGGYGGTMGAAGGDANDVNVLLQLGGAQNTIKNTDTSGGFTFPVDNAIVANVAQTTQILAVGTLTTPSTTGTRILRLRNVAANLIRDGEISSSEYNRTEAAGLGALANLTIDVSSGAGVTIVKADPPMALDNPYFPNTPFRDVLEDLEPGDPLLGRGIGASGTPTEGTAGEFLVTYAPISVTFGCPPSVAPSTGNTSITCTGGTCPTISSITGTGAGPYTITLSGSIPPGQCTTITFNGGNIAGQRLQYQFLPGDADLSGTANTQDMLEVIRVINNVGNYAVNRARYDTNRDGFVNTNDMLRVIQLLNGTSSTQAWNGVSVAACP